MTDNRARSEPPFGVVTIGRNEGERLRACLESVCGEGRPVVYVDSGSTDGSVELARRHGVAVVELDMSQPFSAGRARNEGFRHLQALPVPPKYVQFVDGDCEVVFGWLDAACGALDEHPDVAVVCGRRRERFPERSIYNALCDVEWDTPVGEATMCGGDSMMRASAFTAVGGFHPSMVAGEEPELCVRLRARGSRILRLPEEMTLHDVDMRSFKQWWKRTLRSGHAYAELAALHGGGPEHLYVRETLSNLAWGAVLPAALVVTLPVPGTLVLGGALYGFLAARIYRGEIAAGRTHQQALASAGAATLAKFPETLGMARYWLGAMSGRHSKIIEYKT